MVDKTPHEAMPGSASGLDGYEILLLARTSPASVNSITENNFFGPNNDQASRGDHAHLIADSTRPGFMSTGDRAKLDALATNRQIPAGGATGQIMQKVNSTDYNIAWADPPAGGSGGGWVQQNTQAALTASNPVMALGGMGWETDTGRWKVGDGVTAWNSLAYQDMARTPATITNPGTTATFRFRTDATQIVVFSTSPGGTLTIQAPTSAPPASHEGEMYLRIVNNSGSTITVSAAAFQLDGDYLVSSIPTATTQEYTIWVLAGVWYISGAQDIPDASIGNAQLADIASARIKGRYTAGTGVVEDLVPNQVRWLTDNAQPNVLAISSNTTLTKAAHQGRYLVCSAAVNLTVDASTDFDQYYDATISAVGGAVTIIATATVNAPAGLVIPQGSLGFLRRTTTTDVYSLDVFGHPKIASTNSITGTLAAGTNTLQLSGDAASPGNSKYYGTNSGGSKGFYDLPAGGGASNLAGLTDVVDGLSPSEDQVLVFTSGLWRAATIATAGGSGAFVDNIAALTAIASPTDKQYVYVRGYTTAGDGGGGWFMWDAAAADNKMCTAATVAAGGSGYVVGDLLRPVGGTRSNVEDEATLRVATLSGSAVATVTVVYRGFYSVSPTTSGVATNVMAVGTGCTLNLTMASSTDYGTNFPKDGGGVGRWVRKYEGRCNIKWFGATGNGTTDDTTAVQNAVWSVIPLYVPSGTYRLTKGIWWWTVRTLNINGEGFYGWYTSIFNDARAAGTEEPMFHKFGRWMKADGTYSFETGYEVSGTNLGGVGQSVAIRNISFVSNSSIYGSCFELTLTDDVLFDTCQFEGAYRGLTLGQATFDVTVISCRFTSTFMNNFAWSGTTGGTSNKTIAKRAWGLYTAGHSFILGVAIVGFGTAIRMAGNGPTLRGSRIEVNNYGLIMSSQEYSMGQIDTSVMQRGVVDGFTMEANTIGILVENLSSSTISNFGIQGSVADGARPASEVGIRVDASSYNSTISNFWANGTFSQAAVINLSRYPLWSYTSSVGGSEINYAGTNSIFGNTGASVPSFHCLKTSTSEGSLTAFSDLQIRGLAGLNVRDGYARSLNFGDRVSPATSATTANVTFPTAIGQSTIAFNAITTPADGASTLAAGTYYYATTVVGKNGESGINYGILDQHAHRTVVVATTGLAVSFTFYGGSTSWVKRRIYKSLSAGIFEGYWEITMGANFTDNGTTAYTRRGWPPANATDLASGAEPDTNYEIALSPSWGTTAWVSNKTTTGFTINFGTAAPAGQTCGWLLYRP